MISNVSIISSSCWVKVLLPFSLARALIRAASLLSMTTIGHLRFMNVEWVDLVGKALASIPPGFRVQTAGANRHI